MQLAIRLERGKYIVCDVDTHMDKSPKYDREEQALRYIKYLTDFRKDFRLLEVERLYGETAMPEAPVLEFEPEIIAQDVFTEEVVPEPRPVKDGVYLCSKCNKLHRETSKLGGRHKKYKGGDK